MVWNPVVDRPYMSSADLDPYLTLQPQRQPVELPKGPDWKQAPRGLDLKPPPGEVNLAPPPRTPLDLKPSPAVPPATATNTGFSPTGVRTASPPISAPTTTGAPPPASTQAAPSGSIGGVVGGVGAASLAGAGAGIISFGSRLAAGQSLPQAAVGGLATGVGAGIGTGVGAAIGTAILPGVGTAIGGAIGGAIGAGIGGVIADHLVGPTTAEAQKGSSKSWEQVAYWEAPAGQKVDVNWYDPTTDRNRFPPLVANKVLAFSVEVNVFARDVNKDPYPKYLRIRFLQDFGSGPRWGHTEQSGVGVDPATIHVPGQAPPPTKKGEDARTLPAPLPFALPTSNPEPPQINPRNPANLQNFPKPQPAGTPHPSTQPNLGGNLPNGGLPVTPPLSPFDQAIPSSNPNQPTTGNKLNLPGNPPSGSPAAGNGTLPTLPTGTPPTTPAGVRPSQAPPPPASSSPSPTPETQPATDPRIDAIFKQLEAINSQLALIPALLPPTTQKPLDADQTKAINKDATCEVAQPDGCLGKPLGEIKNEASQASQAAKSADKKLDEVNAALNALDLALLTRMDGKLDTVNNKLGPQIPNGGISGLLQKSSRLLSKTWSFLQVDRVLNVLTFITALHNAYMLSSSLTQTLFSAIANVLDVFGIEDEDGDALDINSMVNKWTESFFVRLFGVSAVAGIKAEWTKLNRIYQAASNIIWSVQSIFDSMRSLTEIAIENTGKIGNALRKAGAVFENAYGTMTEKATARNLWQKKMDNFAEGISGIENVVSNVDSAASEALSIQDTVKELKDQQKEFKDSVAAFKDDADSKEAASKIASVAPQL